ncbi:MAG: hypothetical protein LC099_07995 [Anaerolineales bacterium]|nr:hypothetical protein [Anaerolineales bacterium]
MKDSYAKSLLRSGMIETKAGNFSTARLYLERAIATTGAYDVLAEAWFWMSEATSDPVEKRAALENCLSYDLHYARARRSLALLDGRIQTDELIDPNSPPPTTTDEARQSQADRFMCPKCGGRMTFAADGQTLICEYCAREERVRTANGAENEKDFIAAMFTLRGHGKPLQEQVFHCEGCGAEFILPPDQISASCVYCDSPHVVNYQKENDLLAPDSILPFALNQEQATHSLIQWVEENEIHPEEKVNLPRGMYLPAWTFDIGGDVDYSGERQTYEYNFRTMKMEKKTVPIRDVYPVFENDLTLPASRKLAQTFERLLPSFDLSELKVYDARYLVGWVAELYDSAMGDVSLEARRRALEKVKAQIAKQNFDAVIQRVASARMLVESFKLILLPVWKTEILLDGHKNLILINGRNGAVESEIKKREEKSGGWLDFLTGA